MKTTWTINNLTRAETTDFQSQLYELLIDSVSSGASVGFLPPLAEVDAMNYWQDVIKDLDSGKRILLVAQEDGEVFGTVQLELATKQNAKHRAEIQKLMVHTRHRNKGIAKALMAEVENIARAKEITLLVLDTVQGDTAEKLYEKWGYIRVGVIPNFAKWINDELYGTVVFYKCL
jgi:ribosomal protein S18 acetylase RimI-like enzyme